jgi:hypothetical protein
MTQPSRILWLRASATAAFLLSAGRPSAQAPPSREIPFTCDETHHPYGSTQTITVYAWDTATGGNLIFSEVHTNREREARPLYRPIFAAESSCIYE